MPASVRPGVRSLIVCLALFFYNALPAEQTEDGRDVAALLKQARAGDVTAQLALANHVLDRVDLPADDDQAEPVAIDWSQLERWLIAAAAKGNPEAAAQLGSIYFEGLGGLEQNYSKALAAFTKAASGGSVPAMLTLADFFTKGYGVPVDFAKAEEWLKRAQAKEGDVTGYAEIAATRLQDLAAARERSAEITALRKQADAGDAPAAYKLFEYLGNRDDGLFYSEKDAMHYLRRAAELGEKYAQDELARQLLADNTEEALSWRRKAADQGVGSAQYDLGLDLGYGRGLTRDRAEAARWLMLAAAQGLPIAQQTLASFPFYSGLSRSEAGALLSKPDGLAKLTAAAQKGDAEAQFVLTRSAKLPTRAESATWLVKAAEQGHRAAMTSLAAALNNGDGVPRDVARSLAWYARAAQLGDTEAMMRLAEALLNGHGLAADPALAKFWLQRAASLVPANDPGRPWMEQTAAKIAAAPTASDVALANLNDRAALAVKPGTPPAPVAIVAAAPKPAAPAAPPKRTPEELLAAAGKGDAEAMYQLGLADIERRQIESNKHTGAFYPDPQRNAADFRWIMTAARAGHPEAQFLAATHWLSAETDTGKKAWLEKAAAQDHTAAKDKLAALNQGAAKAVALAAEAAKQAAADRPLAAQGDPDAAFRLFRTRMKEIVATILDDFSAAQNGRPTSGKNFKLGYLDAEMIKWADAITNHLHPDGLVMLHDYLRDARPDFAYRALLLRERIAKTDLRLQLADGGFGTNSRAGFEKALAHLRGKLTADQRAQTEKTTAGQFGGPWVDNVIGANFERGVCGYPQDHGLALVHYRRSAEAGFAAGQTNLARSYHYGLGVAKDLDQARVWYAKAAAQGNATAREQLQLMDALTGMVRLKSLSAEERAKLSELDWAQAEFQLLNGEQREKLHSADPTLAVALGINYRDGTNGFVQDYGRAYVWFSAAVEKGSATAHVEIGNILFRGQGRPTDKPGAFAHYLRAADLGDAVGQLNAGFCYLQGEGVARDPLAAHDWLTQAAAKGQANAQALVETLKRDAGLQLLLAQRNEQQALRNAQQGVATALSYPPSPAPAVPAQPGKPEHLKQTPLNGSGSLHAQPTGDAFIDAMLANYQLPDTGNQEKDLAIIHQANVENLRQSNDLMQKAAPPPSPPVPKAGAVTLANLQMQAIPAAEGLDRQLLLQAMEKLRLDTMGLHLRSTFSGISRYRIKEAQEILAKGDKPKARALLLEAVQAGMTAAVPVWQQHFPDEPVTRPDYRGDQPGLWPGDADWPDAQAKFAEGIIRWETDPAAARPLLEVAAQAGLAEAYTFLATNRKDLRPGDFDILLNAAFDRGHASAAWRQRRVRVFQPASELAVASVEQLTADANTGNSAAGLVLGLKLLPTKPQEALDRIGRLAVDGYGGAEMVLAGLYAQGRVVSADATQVFVWLARAAVKGSQDAQIHFGDYLAGKYGGEAQPAFARFWYLRAAAFPREGDYLARLASLRAAEIDLAAETASRAFAQARKLAATARVPGLPHGTKTPEANPVPAKTGDTAPLHSPAPLLPPPAPVQPARPLSAPVPDGKVPELNPGTFAALQRIKTRNPGALTEADAKELKQMILSDGGQIDDAERDLLAEMTNSQFRNIQVRPVGGKPDAPAVTLFPASGNAKKVLREVLYGKPDFEVEWNRGAPGYGALCTYCQVSPEAEVDVLRFVAGKFAMEWERSNPANSYKPLRDLIARQYSYSNSLGQDTSLGRSLLYRAMNQIDRNSKDQIPDFLYNWVSTTGKTP
ncbi:MAG: hypothetical protein QG602_679 [Verrucomicrobiota bacterium]|nr:hypothetical protein [Verrucomicrobiota bacterium]